MLKGFKTCLAVNFLHLNECKTKTIVFAPSNASGSIYGKFVIKKKKLSDQRGREQLRTLTKVKPFLSFSDFQRDSCFYVFLPGLL